MKLYTLKLFYNQTIHFNTGFQDKFSLNFEEDY